MTGLVRGPLLVGCPGPLGLLNPTMYKTICQLVIA